MRRGWFILGLLVACLGALPCRADILGCGSNHDPWTYKAQGTDVSTSTRLTAQRPFTSGQHLEVDVCSGELQIRRSSEPGIMRLEITSPGADKRLGQYVQAFQAQDGRAKVQLMVPPQFHAVATLYLPEQNEIFSSEVNQGMGTLILRDPDLRGKREVNLGAGTIELTLDGDHGYSSMDVDIGVGKLDDRRPGGKVEHLAISHTFTGSGHGRLEVNLGTGTVVLQSPE